MIPVTKDCKRLILTDMLVAFNGSRRPTDARFARAHENITGIEIFQRDNSLISFIPTSSVNPYKLISDIASVIAVNVDGEYVTSAETAKENDICHFVVDCADYNGAVNLLNNFLNRNVNYCGIFQLTNIDQITPDLASILTIAIADRTFNSKPLSSLFFIVTLDTDVNTSELSSPASKIVQLGFMVKGE
ncbi:hypothetical protein OCF84_20990 (plasmid) [Shewanella xiamenensis]|uniref:Uncharacterized protein n=1 Tax=Shewanella xiamenensis TaxID=332186 RepID=A0ABT6UGT0_9GAMM|nr:hypothetical protein [Shewanella xiamenensis]MDI5833253.1 hypothetical protein [Shewanella xiamenensis]WHF57996.1 hypothetical protein OCF84_20990 [Shewanella xiamenensis]